MVDNDPTQALAGTLHNVMNELLDVKFHSSLIGNTELLTKVALHNAVQNELRTGTFQETFLLPQVRSASALPKMPAVT